MSLSLLVIFIRCLPFLIPGNSPDIPENSKYLNKEAYLIYHQLNSEGLSPEAFIYAYEGFSVIQKKQMLQNDSLITVIDYSLPSNVKRLWVIDIKNCEVIETSLVAHGRASGELIAESFSDTPQSHMSSLGFFITGSTYSGKHGYSLCIDGIEEGINKNARQRYIVFHGAAYVSNNYIEHVGRLGRSFGCPALPQDKNQRIIDLIKGNSCVFIYSPDKSYLNSSKFITPMQISQKVLSR
jgi:hypothetical protein